MIIKDRYSIAIPPGETIKELMEIHNIDKEKFCKLMEMKENDIDKLLIGELSLDNKVAKKLENVFNVEVIFWLRLELNYRNILKEILERNKGF